MPVYGKPHSSEMLVTDRSPKDYIRILGDKERPTPDHVCSPDGVWVIREPNNEEIKQERVNRYKSETDNLLVDIIASRELGQDVTEKHKVWAEKVNQIKSELPYKAIASHYQPTKAPVGGGAENVGSANSESEAVGEGAGQAAP